MAEKIPSENKTHSRIPEDAKSHYHTARQEMRAGIEALLPEGFLTHHRKARREMLLAWRSMLDAAIEQMEKKD